MCRSLASAGHQIALVVADGLGDEEKDGVRILDVGKPRGRLDRMVGASRSVLKRGVELDADIYHLHDPELLPAGLALKRRGKRVIFDAHEDLPRQILSKPYLHPRLRSTTSFIAARVEHFACRRMDAVVAATPEIEKKFHKMGIRVVNANNYPIISEFIDNKNDYNSNEVCYVGAIVRTRGIIESIQAISICNSNVRFTVAGNYGESNLKAVLQNMPGWSRVNDLGFLSRQEVKDVFERSLAGLVTLHPTPAFLDSLPVKMFEYMLAGLPVIASHFPLWREIVEGNECGICVDPLSPDEIAAAIDWLVENPDLARRMGENGRVAVRERYNWEIEQRKLFGLYEELLSRSA